MKHKSVQGASPESSPGGATSETPATGNVAATPDETRARPRQRMSAAERKAQIAVVAIALFGRKGFSGTTTKAIADAAGISEATIFKHFPSKTDLYAEAFHRRTEMGTQWLVERLQEHADRQDDMAVVRTVAEAIMFGFDRDRDLHRMLMYAWLDQDQDANRRMERQMNSPLLEFLARYVTRRQVEGGFRAADPRLMAYALTGLAVGYATRTKLYGLETVDEDAAVAEAIAQLLLDGMRVDPTVERPAPTRDPV